MPYHHGLLNQPDPDRPWGRPQVPQSVISAAEEWGRNPQRPMVSPQGASIGPPQSRMSRIWENMRYGIPRRVEEFLEPETPAGLAGLLGASVMEPAGTAIDVADFAAGFRDRDLPRMGWAAGGAALPFVAGSTMRKVLGKGVKGADGLPMDEASRMGRRADWLADSTVKDRVYHGTTRDIKEFGGEYGNPENHYGAHHYFTDNADDASINYAGEGPDLTSRIELEGERMFGDGQRDEEILDYWRDRDIPNLDEIDDLTPGQLYRAQKQLVEERLGIEHGGAVIPARLRIRNPVVVGGDKETRWLFEQEFDEAGDFVGESGDAIGLIDETRAALRDWGVYNRESDTVMEEILGLLDDGEIAASDFDRVIRDSVEGLFDDVAGESASPGALIADIWKRMGYDAIDMDASVFSRRRGFGGVKLPGMAGTEGARHYVVFDPKNIRSDTAARFDPAQVESANLIAGGAGLLGAGLARDQRERE